MLQKVASHVLRGPRLFKGLGARSFSAAPHVGKDSEAQVELQEFKEHVKAFAQKEIAPLAAKIDHDNDAPLEIWTKMGEFGLLGA